MLRQLTAIIMIFITSFALFVNPVNAESISVSSFERNNNVSDLNMKLNSSDTRSIPFLQGVINGAKAAGGLVIDGTTFAGETVIDGAKAAGGLVVDGTTFAGETVIDGAKAAGGLVINRIKVIENVGDAVETVEDIIKIVSVGGTAICVIGGVASTSIFPPAAAILPYCSAIGIVDTGNAVTKAIKKPEQARRAWNILSHAF